MKRIFSTKDKDHSSRPSISKPKAAPGALQFFTYEDVDASSAPRVGDYPQHGDTVAIGAPESEVEVARSRASKRHSEQIEPEGFQDIFANAPEEPLAPEGPSRRSRDASKRSSKRVSRRGSIEGNGVGPSSSRGSRAISPERPLRVTNGFASPNRDSRTASRQISRRISDVDERQAFHTPEPLAAAPQAEPYAPEPAAPARPLAQPALAAIAAQEARDKSGTPPTAAPSPAGDGSLSQVPTASDGLSRIRTNATGATAPSPAQGQPPVDKRPQSGAVSSRQSTTGGSVFGSRPMSTTGTTKSKSSRRQSKRASKPQPLKYFTYNDVVEGEPPVFGQEPELADGATSRNSRTIKGKDVAGASDRDAPPRSPVYPPQVPELPQRLSQMDMTGTGLSRRGTKDTRDSTQRQPAPQQTRPQAVAPQTQGPDAAQSQLQSAPAPQVQAPSAAAANRLASRDKRNFAVHGLDLSDIPGNARQQTQGAPPPVNMANKPPSKKPSRDLKSGVVAGASRHNDAAAESSSQQQQQQQQQIPHLQRPARAERTSSFQEHLDDRAIPPQKRPDPATLASVAQRETFLPSPVGVSAPLSAAIPSPQELDSNPAQYSVIQRTRDALNEPPNPRPFASGSATATPKGAQTPRTRRVAPPPPQQAQAQPPKPQTPLGQMGTDTNPDGAFVSAPSTPAAEQTLRGFPPPQSSVPSTQEVINKSKYNSADTTIDETIAPAVVHETVHKHIKHVREERITREVHYYDIYHRVQPIVDVEVLSARHFINTHDRGLVEIAEKDLPGGPSNRPNWTIAPRQPSASDRAALLEGRYATAPTGPAGVREETREWMHPDGYPIKETTHIHPPVLNSSGAQTGSSMPFHFDHASGHADFVPPGVPTPSVTRTRGNSITKSVEDAADNLSRVDLQDAKSVPMTAHSGAHLNPGPGGIRQPSTEHLSSQNI